ncbi:MAG: Isoleucine--tRNA ligase 2 [Parcubacteria group bacterium ADurb.Bin326]|nr:MAG: Isoleucine--tRNA ligase 2 [Parcubacteria group bacterium ADurb.Bin326]
MSEEKKWVNPIPEREREIQKFWEDNKIFEKSLEQTKDGKQYSFYDGPPFATGTPHYGHMVASLMKDVVPRFWTMRGRYVERRWGWDCHGLPIENMVEKELEFKSKKDIEEYGIDKFNEYCRSKVLMYVEEWKKTIKRFGRWADMEDSYKTMDLSYMESIWWVFKQLYDKGLVYEGYRSMHVCPRCETTLSQQEVSEGYKDIKDLSVTAKFELVDEPGTYVLAWTTTPWTLPGNVALAVGEDVDYVMVKFDESNLILAKDLVEKVLAGQKFETIKELKGAELVGKKYKPLFPYYESEEARKKLPNSENLYTIVTADFVTTTDGTGVVHIAPAYGEEDMQLGKEKNLSFIQNVTLSGNFKDEVVDFAGMNVKPADDTQKTDVEVIKYLADKNLLFVKEKYEHSYPHCWRCDTPLINYATSSWFVKVTDIKETALKTAKNINWSPEHIKEGRFGNWLEGARDWSISRQRFWASVIPIWQCECGETKVFGSVAELEKESGEKISDLHKHIVDKIEVPCSCGRKMKRIPDVLDTWFDSGSMPYAQQHYPFENEEKFKAGFPAEFIAEGVDQTRAWFYYLHIIASAIVGKNCFDNVIVNGIVLADDGKKMSKRLANYTEPDLIMEQYGADALRYYLLTSPVMQAENVNFDDNGVKEAMQKVVMLLNNILSFYKTYQHPGEKKESLLDKIFHHGKAPQSDNILDAWLLAKLNVLIAEVAKQMEAYDLPRSARPIQEFIDEFSTWWLRRSRDRFKSDNEADKQQALTTFKYVLLELSKVMAPFTPFIAEQVYREVGGKLESVHLEKWPEAEKADEKVIEDMELVRKAVELGLAKRSESGIKIRQPLSELSVYGLNLNESALAIIANEVNVKKVLINKSSEIKVELNTEITEKLKLEGALRELVRTINGMRKDAGLTIKDNIKIKWESEGEIARKVFSDPLLSEELKKSTITQQLQEEKSEEKPVNINGEKVKLQIEKV